jgi:hypothetical protein
MLRRQDRANILINVLIVFLIILGQGTFALSLIIQYVLQVNSKTVQRVASLQKCEFFCATFLLLISIVSAVILAIALLRIRVRLQEQIKYEAGRVSRYSG